MRVGSLTPHCPVRRSVNTGGLTIVLREMKGCEANCTADGMVPMLFTSTKKRKRKRRATQGWEIKLRMREAR